jgi:3-oxoacyl-[acyl-carrier-protein] synthase-1
MTDLYLHGRSLVSALGPDLRQAVDAVARGGAAPQRRALPGGSDWPWFGIASVEGDWRTRAQALLRAAIDQAGISAAQRRAPLYLATSSMHIGAIEAGEGGAQLDYTLFAQEVAGWLAWQGPVAVVSTACTSALHALAAAAADIRAGVADEALVLGLELANRFTLAGFAGMQLLSPRAPLPLGRDRDGLVLGEAVAALHVSREPSRWKLGAVGSLVDGRDPTGARPETVARLCGELLAQAGRSPEAIDVVKLQAAGSPGNDAHEIEGLRQVFAGLPALVSLKATLGHTLGASGAAEVALLLECLERGVLPRVDYPLAAEIGAALAQVAPARVRSVLALILGFGGGYAGVVLEDQHG